MIPTLTSKTTRGPTIREMTSYIDSMREKRCKKSNKKALFQICIMIMKRKENEKK